MDVEIIRKQINDLLLAAPELAEDDILRADMIEAETNAIDFLRRLERNRQVALATIEALRQWVDTIMERSKRFDAREHAIRTLMFKVLQTANLQKIELPEATLSIRAGMPKVIIVEESEIPNYYVRIKREPNKILIGAALKAGTNVPGATLSNAEPTLAIRTK
jgi:hypothetical protein